MREEKESGVREEEEDVLRGEDEVNIPCLPVVSPAGCAGQEQEQS